MEENLSRYEEHIICSYFKICWIYESEAVSIQSMFWNNEWPRYYYVVRLLNDWRHDIINKWQSWVRAVYFSFSWYIEQLCVLLTVKFWKLFEYVWCLKNNNIYNIVDFSQPKLKYNYFPWVRNENRIDIKDEINLTTNVWPFFEEFLEKLKDENEEVNNFVYIASFYQKALINSQYDEEISYIDLVRVIEVYNLVKAEDIWGESIFEGDLKLIYDDLSTDELKWKFESYHWSTKKFYKKILSKLPIGDNFWKSTESNWEHFSLTKIQNIEKSIKNIYQVRSKYVHEWESFHNCLLPNQEWNNEIIHSSPSWNTVLKIWDSFTLLWVERLMRAVLLKFFDTNTL